MCFPQPPLSIKWITLAMPMFITPDLPGVPTLDVLIRRIGYGLIENYSAALANEIIYSTLA
jgi:hypothetical protein